MASAAARLLLMIVLFSSDIHVQRRVRRVSFLRDPAGSITAVSDLTKEWARAQVTQGAEELSKPLEAERPVEALEGPSGFSRGTRPFPIAFRPILWPASYSLMTLGGGGACGRVGTVPYSALSASVSASPGGRAFNDHLHFYTGRSARPELRQARAEQSRKVASADEPTMKTAVLLVRATAPACLDTAMGLVSSGRYRRIAG